MTKLEKFFMRIGMEPDTEIEFTTEFLGRVQTNSVLHIAYENLDILDHKPIILTPDACAAEAATVSS